MHESCFETLVAQGALLMLDWPPPEAGRSALHTDFLSEHLLGVISLGRTRAAVSTTQNQIKPASSDHPTSIISADLRYAWHTSGLCGYTHTDVAPSVKSANQIVLAAPTEAWADLDPTGLLNATKIQQETVTDLTFNPTPNPERPIFEDDWTQFDPGYSLTQAHPLNYRCEFGLTQFPSALFEYNVGPSQDEFGRPNAEPYNGAVSFAPQIALQQNVSNAPQFQVPFDTPTVGDNNGRVELQTAMPTASLQPGPALAPLTRHRRGTRAPTGKTASQEKGNRIECAQDGCQKTFGRPAEFRRHLDTKHSRRGVVRCMVCTYEYPRMDKVRSHMEKMHGLRVEKMSARSASPELEDEE
ncbi:hypothetical protein K458DRAFT_487618 [Lentithecium fluviatile CBS 122367]|uniref:C2H2-type domain-containing protein n=1 Tax=Lentithecium fluviatile CBS 122367 TaxID=1168545 RepID=A0A6G1J0R8_9PLEO|nr:hypothetical protein K458DRAFT_487618 [Lentithecium fluviatile CBS 122367]